MNSVASQSGTKMKPMLIIPQLVLQLDSFCDDLMKDFEEPPPVEIKDESPSAPLQEVVKSEDPPEQAEAEKVEPTSSKDVNNNKPVSRKRKKRSNLTTIKRRKKTVAEKRQKPKAESSAVDIVEQIELENFICSLCDKKFDSQELLQSHLTTEHDENGNKVSVEDGNEDLQGSAEVPKPKEEDVFPKLWVLTAEEKKTNSCSVCKKTFSRVSILRVHKKRHFDPNTYHCDHCNKDFNSKSTYRHHRAYSGLAPYKCSKCPKSFYLEGKCQEHVARCEGKVLEKKYSCEICGRSYLMKCSLRTHIKERHTEFKPAKNLCCEFCGKRFRHKKYLVAHVHSHSNERNYVCEICRKAYKSNDILRNHIRMAHKGPLRVSCEICHKEVSRISLKNHMKRHRDKSQETKIYEEIIAHDENSPACRVCGKRFEKEKHLEMHCCQGTGGFFKCCDCTEAFGTAEDVANHSCSVKSSGETKIYICVFCNRQYNSHTPWLYHVRHHTGFKPYQCSDCDKSFRLKQGLKVHMRNHTGEKPFQCHLCPAAFKQKPFLLDHVNTHTGDKPYQCDHCMNRFSVRSALSIHKRIHRREIQLQRLPATNAEKPESL